MLLLLWRSEIDAEEHEDVQRDEHSQTATTKSRSQRGGSRHLDESEHARGSYDKEQERRDVQLQEEIATQSRRGRASSGRGG